MFPRGLTSEIAVCLSTNLLLMWLILNSRSNPFLEPTSIEQLG